MRLLLARSLLRTRHVIGGGGSRSDSGGTDEGGEEDDEDDNEEDEAEVRLEVRCCFAAGVPAPRVRVCNSE